MMEESDSCTWMIYPNSLVSSKASDALSEGSLRIGLVPVVRASAGGAGLMDLGNRVLTAQFLIAKIVLKTKRSSPCNRLRIVPK
jgi:hypothetical protein